MHPSIAASSIAADSLGYHGIAQLIIEQQLIAPAIARLFSLSASRDAGHAAAVVILAAATARFNSCREGFDGDLERDLAIKALGGEAGFVAANKHAVKLVQSHWREITANAVAHQRVALTAQVERLRCARF
jgi:hypothetical protein